MKKARPFSSLVMLMRVKRQWPPLPVGGWSGIFRRWYWTVCTHHHWGTTNLTFFLKMKNTDPLMGTKLKSKTHLQNTFFDFLSRFLCVWLQSLKEVQIWPKNIFFFLNQKRCQKTQNFTLISNPLKKLLKNARKKSYKQNKFDEHE